MNLVKAADDLKNLSDQQLMVAGQNPVAVPPYLVLAEMKRREQLRAEYAKAQQGQQQQQPVIQQVAQNLAQGQPQQQQPQAQPNPQAQGIMQAMPQGAMGMAGGGHVARYADKGRVVSPYQDYSDQALRLMGQMANVSMARPRPPSSNREAVRAEYERAYKMPGIQEKIDAARALLGAQDYSQYEDYLRRQRAEAEAGRPVLGAAFTAGAREMSRFDPRETFAGKLARGIMGATEAIQANREQKKKDIQTAVLAEMAFKNILQQNKAKEIDLASQMASSERGNAISMMNMIESRIQREQEAFERAQTDFDRFNAQKNLETLNAQLNYVRDLAKMQAEKERTDKELQNRLAVANIGAGARSRGASDPRVMQLNALKAQEVSLKDTLKSLMDQKKSIPLGRRGDAERASINEQIKNATAQLSKIQAPLASLSGIKVVDLPGEHD
jgi:hypothetical protein